MFEPVSEMSTCNSKHTHVCVVLTNTQSFFITHKTSRFSQRWFLSYRLLLRLLPLASAPTLGSSTTRNVPCSKRNQTRSPASLIRPVSAADTTLRNRVQPARAHNTRRRRDARRLAIVSNQVKKVEGGYVCVMYGMCEKASKSATHRTTSKNSSPVPRVYLGVGCDHVHVNVVAALVVRVELLLRERVRCATAWALISRRRSWS